MLEPPQHVDDNGLVLEDQSDHDSDSGLEGILGWALAACEAEWKVSKSFDIVYSFRASWVLTSFFDALQM